MKKFGQFCFALVMIVVGMFLTGLEAYMGWNWVVVSVFKISPLTYFGAIGVGAIISWPTLHFRKSDSKDLTAEVVVEALGTSLGYLLASFLIFGAYKIFFS